MLCFVWGWVDVCVGMGFWGWGNWLICGGLNCLVIFHKWGSMTCEDFCKPLWELYQTEFVASFLEISDLSHNFLLFHQTFIISISCLEWMSTFSFFLSFLPSFVHLVGCWRFLLFFGGWVEDAFSFSDGFIYLNRWASSLVSCMVHDFWWK